MQDRAEQIHAPGRRAVEAGRPAPAGGAAVEEDGVAQGRSERERRQVADLHADAVEGRKVRVTRAEHLCPQLLRLGNDRCKLLAAQRGASRVRRRRPIGELPDRQRTGGDTHIPTRVGIRSLRVARPAGLVVRGGVALCH